MWNASWTPIILMLMSLTCCTPSGPVRSLKPSPYRWNKADGVAPPASTEGTKPSERFCNPDYEYPAWESPVVSSCHPIPDFVCTDGDGSFWPELHQRCQRGI